MPRLSTPRRHLGWLALLGAVTTGFGCAGAAPPEPEDRPPTITVTGVADGETRTGPVTIQIAVDVGSYRATLNGETFVSGRTVAGPGDYTLVVTATSGGATATVTVAFSIAFAGDSVLIIRVFDLGPNAAGGGGDAVLLSDSSAAGQQHVLVDAGPAGADGADPSYVRRQLDALGVDTLEALILSHAHTDHFGGMDPVLRAVHVKAFVYNGQVRTLSQYAGLIALAQAEAEMVTTPTVAREARFGLGSVRTAYTVLPALATYLSDPDATSSQINDGSLGVAVERGAFRMFVTGDGEVEANGRWRTQFAARTEALTVLKVGHHGANDAVFDNGFNGGSAWLEHTSPEVALVSANGTSHPRLNATNALLALAGVTTRCTSVHGTLELRVGEAGAYSVSVERAASASCAPGADATTF